MGRKWTMRITALEGHWSYLAVVDGESGVWTVDPETYVRQDNGMTLEEVEESLAVSRYHCETIPGGFGPESRHVMFVQEWRPGSAVLEVDPPYDYDPNVVY